MVNGRNRRMILVLLMRQSCDAMDIILPDNLSNGCIDVNRCQKDPNVSLASDDISISFGVRTTFCLANSIVTWDHTLMQC